MENEEKVRELGEIGERLEKIGSLLRERGQFKLGDSDVHPPDPCFFIIRYERMPRGELSLKLELLWEDVQLDTGEPRIDDDLPIE